MNESASVLTLTIRIFADANVSKPYLKRGVVPSRNLPIRSLDKKISSPRKEKLKLRTEKPVRRRIKLENVFCQQELLSESVPNESADDIEAATALLLLQSTK